MNKNVIYGLIVLILVAGAVMFFFERNGAEDGEEATGDVSGLRVGENAVYVPEQKQGRSVLVGLVVLAEGGFVVIHEDVNASPGPIIGASGYLPAGEPKNVSIPLTRETTQGDMLMAMLHRDAGDQSFAAADDPGVVENGGIVMMNFSVSENAPEPGEVAL
mgnify:CR=1 FL=1